MALIPCRKCGALVSDKADACPVCGTPLNEEEVVGGTLDDVKQEPLSPPHTPVTEEKPIRQEIVEEPQIKTTPEKTSGSKKVYIGIIVGLLLIAGISSFFFFGSDSTTSSEMQVGGKRSFQDIQIVKNFKKGKAYYRVDVKISWPEALEGGGVKPLQSAIMSKAFGFSRETIDEALTEFFKEYGEEVSQVPEWNGEFELNDVILVVKEECYVNGIYSAFSIYHSESAWGGSPHATDVSRKFVNYDIQNQQVLGLTDIFDFRTSASDILAALKTNRNTDWDNVYNPDELPTELLLTDEFVIFDFRGWQTATERAVINWKYSDYVSNMLSKHVKELFGKEEKVDETGQQERFLKEFYTNYIFGHEDFYAKAKEICTPQMLTLLKREYEDMGYECEDGECYGLWIFRTSFQDGPSDVEEVQEVTNMGDGWYKVTYLDMGNNGETLVRLEDNGGKLMISDIKKDKSF